jgi:hypothetical protein
MGAISAFIFAFSRRRQADPSLRCALRQGPLARIQRVAGTCLIAACLGLLPGCASGDGDEPKTPAEEETRTQAQPSDGGAGANPAPPPDAGTGAGHAADTTPRGGDNQR